MSRKNIEVYEMKHEVFARDQWICQSCGRPLFSGVPQLAHMIPQNKSNLRKWGKKVIHHPSNFKSACSLRCNHALQLPSWEWDDHANMIKAIQF